MVNEQHLIDMPVASQPPVDSPDTGRAMPGAVARPRAAGRPFPAIELPTSPFSPAARRRAVAAAPADAAAPSAPASPATPPAAPATGAPAPDRRGAGRPTPDRRVRPRAYASPWMVRPDSAHGLHPRPDIELTGPKLIGPDGAIMPGIPTFEEVSNAAATIAEPAMAHVEFQASQPAPVVTPTHAVAPVEAAYVVPVDVARVEVAPVEAAPQPGPAAVPAAMPPSVPAQAPMQFVPGIDTDAPHDPLGGVFGISSEVRSAVIDPSRWFPGYVPEIAPRPSVAAPMVEAPAAHAAPAAPEVPPAMAPAELLPPMQSQAPMPEVLESGPFPGVRPSVAAHRSAPAAAPMHQVVQAPQHPGAMHLGGVTITGLDTTPAMAPGLPPHLALQPAIAPLQRPIAPAGAADGKRDARAGALLAKLVLLPLVPAAVVGGAWLLSVAQH